MKFAIVFVLVAVIALAAGAIVSSDAPVEVLKYDNDNIGLESYIYNVETSDGTRHSEEGALKKLEGDSDGIAVKGSYSYVGPDGVTYTVDYVADEKGFQPSGAHLPQNSNV